MTSENTPSAGRGDRILKIEADGDFWFRGLKPKIRLCGKWLDRAGFKSGHRVRVTSQKLGELTLQFIELPEETNDPF